MPQDDLKPPIELNSFEIDKIRRWLTYRPPRGMSEANDVARIGDEAIPYLRWRKAYKAREAAACVRALGLIGGPKALEALGTYHGDLRKSVFRELLTASGKFEDSDFQGVFSNLTIEHIKIKGAESLSGLRYMTSLTKLYVSLSPKVRDIEPLSYLQNLEKLVIYYHWNGADLSPLSKLKALRYLSFVNCSSLRDLSPLSALTQLKSLDIGTCRDFFDCSPLSTLINLESIAFSNCQITNIDSLESMKNLRRIHLCSCNSRS
jgi:hypothetical protein